MSASPRSERSPTANAPGCRTPRTGALRRAPLALVALLLLPACADFPAELLQADSRAASADLGDATVRDAAADAPVGPKTDAGPPRDTRPGADAVSTSDTTAIADTAAGADAAPACPTAICASCAGGVCEMDCTNGCTCPKGIPCKAVCAGQACTGKIDCSQASACDVSCTDDACTDDIVCPASGPCGVGCEKKACSGKIFCGPGRCTIACGGESCKDIDCSQSCACSVTCKANACNGSVFCPAGCTKGSDECLATSPTCDSCL